MYGQAKFSSPVRKWLALLIPSVLVGPSVLFGSSLLFGSAAGAAESNAGLLIRFDAEWRPVISRLEAGQNQMELPADELGLVIWSEPSGDRRALFQGSWRRPLSAPTPRWEQDAVRSIGPGGSFSNATAGQLTTQLDPLFLPGVVKSLRGAKRHALLTPYDGGVSLTSRPTFRRLADEHGKLPAAVIILSSGGTTARIALADSQKVVRFGSLQDLPPTWASGLPSGEYRVAWQGVPDSTSTFRVVETPIRQAFDRQLGEWQQVLGNTTDALYPLIAVELLMAGRPQPYLADVLDRIDEVPPAQLTSHLAWRRASVVAVLRSQSEPLPPELAKDRTGIAVVDAARLHLARGRWKDSLESLDKVGDADDRRTQALAELYRGVLHAEWGQGQEQAADFYFRKALVRLEGASSADRFRALNNFANFLLDRTQDRVLDHAFQMAAGVHGLFTTAVESWDDSRRFYAGAAVLAGELGDEPQAAVALNQARLEAILADLLVTLDSPVAEQRRLAPAVLAAMRRAEAHVERALAKAPKDSSHLRAVACGLRAQLAVRSANLEAGRRYASEARQLYVRIGSLTGIESVERLLGFVELRSSERPAAEARQAARKHFLTAQRLAETLRERLPRERVGRTCAGFFARRAYVHEQLVELLLADGHDREALKYAERAKARALEDLLTAHDSAKVAPGRFDLQELLDDWPEGVAALEYFLTRQGAWVFHVNRQGAVRAFPLTDESGQPITARELISQVQAVLRSEFNQYGALLRQRMLAGKGFDHDWQDRLHQLYRTLIPERLRTELDDCETLLIVPHHVLHYFPFAALVRETDSRRRGKLEMVQPQFLLDASCAICYAPSLGTWQRLRLRPNQPLDQVAAAVVPELPGAVPLPGVAQELRYLADAFPKRLTRILAADKATRADTRKLLERSGMLLVGTHGQNYPDQPLASELFLYPTGRDSGRLTAAELYGAEVRADLVVLSACYTALADRSPLPGDDLFGLSRALLQSGSRTVVTGYWDVYEGTGPELTRGLFDQLAEGKSVPLALANSQRRFVSQLRKSTDPEPWLHPYFWAVFGTLGDDRTRFQIPP